MRVSLIRFVILCTVWVSSFSGVVAQEGTGELYDGTPVWSPDGEWIAFTSGRDGTFDIWIVKPDGTGLKNLTPDNKHHDANPQWSPDGQMISFLSNRSGYFKIWAVQVSGENLVNLMDKIAGSAGLHSWSPNGKYIAVAVYSELQMKSNIWMVSLDGSQVTNLTKDEKLSFNWPSWSSDGSAISFISIATADNIFESTFNGIWVADLQAGINRPLASDRPYMTAVWTANRYILATVQIAADVDIWRIDSGNGLSVNLTPDTPTLDGMPAWSPDKSKIAFVSRRDGQADIWIMDVNGENLINLTANIETNCIWPTWSPDGGCIIMETSFGSLTDLDTGIIIINVETLEATMLIE